MNQKQRDYLNDIQSSSRTLLAIINDILDLATIDAGTFDLKLAKVDVNSVMAATNLALTNALNEKNIKLETAVDVVNGNFIADESRVIQILNNLLTNAIGFSEMGGRIEFGCREERGMMVFRVKDEGVGIAERDYKKIFERFESRTKGAQHRGPGLGLSIVKSIVELHHGDVTLLSEEGHGAEFIVRFPVDGPNGKKLQPADADSLEQQGATDTHARGAA